MIITNNLVEPNVLKSYIKAKFVEEFLSLFDSENPAERDILKNILHKLYAKVSFYSEFFSIPTKFVSIAMCRVTRFN